ncbi:hypothetical protein Tco_1355472 [Tanacetum coccineum]
MIVLFVILLDHDYDILDELDRGSTVGYQDVTTAIVDVGKLWEHIPIVGWMIVKNKRCGELRIGTRLMDM